MSTEPIAKLKVVKVEEHSVVIDVTLLVSGAKSIQRRMRLEQGAGLSLIGSMCFQDDDVAAITRETLETLCKAAKA